MNAADLAKQLQETQSKLREALEKIGKLENTMQENH